MAGDSTRQPAATVTSSWRMLDRAVAGAVLATFAALVLLRSHFFGGLTDDSNAYLALAGNLVAGRGWHLPALGAPDQLFAIWPVGYPTLIALVAKLGHLPVFDASKVLNIGLALANLLLLKRIFGRDFPWFAWLLLLPPMVELGTHTWSEVPFLTGMLWLAVSAARFIDGDTPLWRGALEMGLATATLFLSRYIGAFAIGVVGLVALLCLVRGQWRAFWAASAVTLLTAAGAGAYLYNNLLATGHATGMQRLPAPEPAAWLAAMTFKAYLAQIDVLLARVDLESPAGRAAAGVTSVALLALVAYTLAARRSPDPSEVPQRVTALPATLIGVGLAYLAGITVMRWISHFDSLSMRLLFPGTLPVLLGLLLVLRRGTAGRRLRRAVPAGIAVGLVVLVGSDQARWQREPVPLTHAQRVDAVLASVAQLPQGAVVVFGDVQLAYLRPDLLVVRPTFRPLHARMEPWDEFVARVTTQAAGQPVFAFIEPDLDPQRFHPSVVAFMASRRGDPAPIRLQR